MATKSQRKPLDRESHIGFLFKAELQFRFAWAAQLKASLEECVKWDLPIVATYGTHEVEYAEVALRPDQATYASGVLHHSATFLMAVAIRDAVSDDAKLRKWPEPQQWPEGPEQHAFAIAKLVRDAFSHAPFRP